MQFDPTYANFTVSTEQKKNKAMSKTSLALSGFLNATKDMRSVACLVLLACRGHVAISFFLIIFCAR